MSSTISKDFIFTEDESGNMLFVGDFDGFYDSDDDPWAQSAKGESSLYYKLSRGRVSHWLIKTQADYEGWDISKAAIFKARKMFPQFAFEVRDITATCAVVEKKYDVVILNQLLWYILPRLDDVMTNCLRLLTKSGHLIISNAFAREQRFGNEYINGFSGAFEYFHSLDNETALIHTEFNDDGCRNQDGLFVLRKN